MKVAVCRLDGLPGTLGALIQHFAFLPRAMAATAATAATADNCLRSLSLSLSLSPEETLILLMGESKDGQPLGRRAADAAASSLLAAHMQQCRARTPTWSDHFLASCLLSRVL